MKDVLRRLSWLLVWAAVCLAVPVRAEPPQVAAIEQLKSEAFKALRGGEFGRSNELLGKAASLSNDPAVVQMARWIEQFESQRQAFLAERRNQYDRVFRGVTNLSEEGKITYALEQAAKAHLLAEDKRAFHNQPLILKLIADAVRLADQSEQSNQWITALRIYSELGVLEPANAEWKERLKQATRRIRLLALYVPDQLKQIRQAEDRERREVEAMLRRIGALPVDTAAATQPAENEDAADTVTFDWRDSLRGIAFDMLWDAIDDARSHYYREVSYLDLMRGGLRGLRTLATTTELQNIFPKLGDVTARDAFVAGVDKSLIQLAGGGPGGEKYAARNALAELRGLNRNTINLPEEVLVSEFADGALGELDPFSGMIWPSDIEEFNKATQGEFSGVGIQIQLDKDGSLKVVSPLEDSPAYKSGVKAGDVITHIDGKSAKGITLNQAVKKITGISGTEVTLTIRSPDGGVRPHKLVRETIKVASIKGWSHRNGGGWDYLIDPEQKVAYVRLTNFSRTTADDLERAIEQLRQIGARGLILDLRYNPGGLLTSATEVVDKFVRSGRIVSTRADRQTPNGPTVISAKSNGDELDLPLVVLVNQYSASASEIVSGALKDQGRALIVGERTFGKGSVQMLFPVADRHALLKLTTSHYYLPSGRCIHREENSTEWGVDPDLTIEMTPEQMRAAIDARQELDVLRDQAPAEPETGVLNQVAAEASRKDPLQSDAQLSAALLLLRMQLAGATL